MKSVLTTKHLGMGVCVCVGGGRGRPGVGVRGYVPEAQFVYSNSHILALKPSRDNFFSREVVLFMLNILNILSF